MTLYQIELSILAKYDLEDIALYTLSEYGLKQQDLYLSLIDKGFYTIAENPYIGHGHCDLSNDIQIWKVAKHIIIYIVDNAKNIVYVLRVLHENTDVKSHSLIQH